MRIDEYISAVGGIVHRRQVMAARYSRPAVAAALASGTVTRIRRDWLAVASCHPFIVRAVAIGGTLSCISAAVVRELWVVDDGALHVVVPRHSGHVDTEDHPWIREGLRPVTRHWTSSPRLANAPRPSLDSVQGMLTCIASCQSETNALAVFESAVTKRLVSLTELQLLAPTRREAFRRVVAATTALSDSGVESITKAGLAAVGIEMRQQVVIDGHRVDGLIGERLVLQLDGFDAHSTPDQHDRDLRQDSRLEIQGYVVLRFSARRIRDDWPGVLSEILAVLAQGRHLWAADAAHA
ncbi:MULTISPECIES: endonuclease domain-containing protein [unclassified Leifsonia]|uniref:endonuclease domain-containing protein n=1 Tax=unclassified Leifsonia TaxID=2663824 RepID=UPI000701BE5A|nr:MULTISPECIES: type IV toxin-antitoxin system AbiEi family antitoxin domain-containing protein [unclassified Leifsonia]KQX05694.1 hypothetical protein ASC59_16630 [Leifsonia sp. Root1293]KRA09330.1 hypothetical protein ASD61_16625 [Leifsonia sp. Root60]